MCRCASLLLLSLFCVASGFSSEDGAKSDLQMFQGAWQPISILNTDGQPTSAEELKAVRLEVKGNGFALTNKDVTISGTFTIDSSKSPKTIDFLLADGKSPDQKFLGVYEIRGERRLSCFALPLQPRPPSIRPSAKGYLMFEWKPAAQ